MARTIEFAHTIYDLQGYVGGSDLFEQSTDHREQLIDLINGADWALHRREGYFFETVDTDTPTFVFGFLLQGVRKEGFFDIYATPLENVRRVSLADLEEKLAQNSARIDGRDDAIDVRVTAEVTELAPKQDGQGRVGDQEEGTLSASSLIDDTGLGSDGPLPYGPAAPPSGEPVETMSCAEIADIWERYRRGQEPVRLSLHELTRFLVSVSGALEHVNYVSPLRDDPQYFDFVEGNTSRSFDTSELAERLRTERDSELHWDQLPTYEEELRDLYKGIRTDLREADDYDESWSNIKTWLENELREKIWEVHRDRVEQLFEQTSKGELPEDQQGRLEQIREVVDRSNDHYDQFADGREMGPVDENEREVIAKELHEELRLELEENLKEFILADLERGLERLIEDETKAAVDETLDALETLYTSSQYERADSTLFE